MPVYTQYSSLTTEANNKPTQARYPALKHFFQFKETSGTTLTDVITGGTIECTSMTFPAAGAVAPTSGSNKTFNNATLTELGTSKALILQVGEGAAAGITYGSASTGARINTFAIAPFIHSGSGQDTGTAFGGSGVQGVIMNIDVGGNLITGRCASTGYTQAGSVATTNVSTLTGFSNVMTMTGMTSLYSSMVWVFDGDVPTDYKAAALWMTYYHQQGNSNKVAYPGWIGIE